MIIHDFYILGACTGPAKAEPELVVDPNAVLSGAVASERFKSVARRNAQVIKSSRHFKLPQFSQRNPFELSELSNTLPGCQPLSVTALE